MSTPAKIKLLIKKRGCTYSFLMKQLGIKHKAYMTHALDTDSPRFNTQAMKDIRSKLYKFLTPSKN